jgi:hypothetical protein
MKNNDLYSFFAKYKLLLVALLLLFFTVVVLQVNYNKNHMHDFHVDEYYTIATIHPKLTPDNMVHRALNGPRMFTYLFYPGAMVGMINHMGGNIYEDGWKYPGHNYFVNNYKTSSSRLQDNMEDPNLRYFHYYLKLQAIVFMFLSFIPLVFLLWKKKFYVGMFMVATLVGINLLALEERSLFYIEPLLMSMMNLLIWLYFFLAGKKRISWFWIIFSSFLFAITISLKFSVLFIIILLAALMVSKFKTLEKRLTASVLLIIFSLFFFCLINWNIFYSKEVFNAVVHDYFSNFWHYATGNKGEVVEHFKLHNLKNVIGEVYYSLGGLVFLLPVILFFGLKWTPRKAVLPWIGFIGAILFSIALILKQQLYSDRNILPFLVALILIMGVMLDQIISHILKSGDFKNKIKPIYLYGIITAIIFLPIWGHSKNYSITLFPNAKDNIEKVIEEIEDKENRRLVMIDYPNEKGFDSFSLKKDFPSAILTNGQNFKSFITNSLGDFQSNDVVVVSEVKNNKQLTTYVLPNIFNTNIQYGKYFVFYNTASKNKKFQRLMGSYDSKNTKSIFLDSLAIREDLILREIKITKGNKIYFKFDFLATNDKDWNGCRFYFHGKAYDDDINKLPLDRIQYGFEGWDFSVSQENTIKYGNSMYIIEEFKPTLEKYKEFSFGIFRGCTKSGEFKVKNVVLPE